MSKSHLPTSCVTPSIVTTCHPPLNSLERIAQDVPLRMPARRLLNVAGVGFVAFCPECFADFLRFLTSD